MHQARFEEEHQQEWQHFGEILSSLQKRRTVKREQALLEELPSLYRRICSQYSLALRRRYTSGLSAHLHSLVLQGHRHLYQRRGQGLQDIFLFLHRTFPLRVRQARAYVLTSLALFLLPALILGWLSYRDSTFIYTVMPAPQVEQMERMYDRSALTEGEAIQRDDETDFVMFGHYVSHNISIGFRTFAGGMLFGIGAVFALIYNGAVIGSVAGHLSHPPYHQAFWPFVAGHSSWELSAIVLCGAAGLMLGMSLLRPGRYRRLDALRQTAPLALQLVLGAVLMLLLAAVIEAFWSAQPLPHAIKYGFSLFNWSLVILYLCTGGRTAAKGNNAA